MFNATEILKALACDNAPRMEVCHDTKLANSALDEPEGCGEALQMDPADAGGDQEDAVQPSGRCVMCGDPVADGRDIHIECIPF